MRILLLSAYDAASHRYWRESLVAEFPEYEWKVLSLSPRYFNFRVRGNPLSWSASESSALSAAYDLVIATSLVDMATLRGLYPSLASTPLWLYCHENQFAYPASPGQSSRTAVQHGLEAKMVFLYNCLCAGQVSFNSHWNRQSALDGLQHLLSALPESFERDYVADIAEKSDVLPVPLPSLAGRYEERNAHSLQKVETGAALDLVWNHRWEYDKGPEYLLAFVRALQAAGVAARLHVVGQQFRQQPQAFTTIRQLLDVADSSVTFGEWGFIESTSDYHQLLDHCDIVLSTALHDFQGLAVMEAVQRGCLPLLPDRLAYPEQYADYWQYAWQDRPEDCAQAMLDKLRQWRRSPPSETPSVVGFEWTQLAGYYRRSLQHVALTGARE